MRHKYSTTALVLARTPIGEANALVTLLTPEFGLIRTRVQGIRKPGAKLASALQTLSECDAVLIRGKDGWRLTGAILEHAWFPDLSRPARVRAGRTAALLLRLVHGEVIETSFYTLFRSFLQALYSFEQDTENLSAIADTEALQDAAECLIVLRFLQLLGVDAGEIPGGPLGEFEIDALITIVRDRPEFISRINRGIAASGL